MIENAEFPDAMLLELHRRTMRQSIDIVHRVLAEQWVLPTPCNAWNLQQLLVHMITENNGFAAAPEGVEPTREAWRPPTLTGDPRADYARSAEDVIAAYDVEGVLDQGFWLPLLREELFPGRMAVAFHLLDYVVHGWDVAVSIGYRVIFDDDLVAAVRAIGDRYVPDGEYRSRPGASFGPPVPVPLDASAQDQMLAALGRSPSWPD